MGTFFGQCRFFVLFFQEGAQKLRKTGYLEINFSGHSSVSGSWSFPAMGSQAGTWEPSEKMAGELSSI